MKNTFQILILSISLLISAGTVFAQFDTLCVMYYNTLNYPDGGDPNREDYFRTTNLYVQADVILINELTSATGATTLLNDALNVHGTSHYQKASYSNGPDTDNMLFYNSDKLVLHSQWYIPTALRHINEYVLYYKSDDLGSGGDTIYLYFYSAHLKAFPEDSLQRLAEVNDFKARVNSLPNAENIFFGGDLNLYTSTEPAYDALINDGLYPLTDPLPAGNWHNTYSYRFYHTQSTRTTSFGGGSTGGMDDRFDFILFSEDVTSGANRVEYINGSCIAFGNDGDDFNQALYPPDHPSIPDSVINALYYMSDHLPVICDLKINATIDTTASDIVITEIMYNPPEGGADSLEFIELYNNGPIAENLGGYYFSAGISYIFPSVEIAPGEFLVTAINASAMQNTFGVSTYQWTSGGLSNGGELIMLMDASGNTIDSVHYDDASPWPTSPDGSGPSLILCDPASNNSIGSNWQASANFVMNNGNGDPIYATPGFTECGFPPVADFSADVTEIFAGESVSFTDLSLNSPTSWSWSFPGGDPATSTSQNQVVTYDTPGVYSVSLAVSNASGSDNITISDYISVLSSDPVVIISEIMQNPSSVYDSEGEWFEVYNPTNSSVDLNGWKIKDNDSDSHTINGTVIVPAYGFAVLGIKNDPGINGDYVCDYQYSNFLLANGADEIVILNSSDEEIDRVEYDGGPNWPDPNGYSMIFTGTATDENNNYSNWQTSILREPTYSGTSGDKGSPGTNGTGQNLGAEVDPELDLKVFLQGPFNGLDMNSELNSILPLNQPFNTIPWNYNGTESVANMPAAVVDWVLVELRDAPDASSATPSTTIGEYATFLLSDGSVVDLDAVSNIIVDQSISQSLFVIIWHRNHLGIMSSSPLTESDGIYTYDFTTSQGQAYNNALENLTSGVWGMISGDSDASGQVDEFDKSIHWESVVGTSGYLGSDLDLNTQVNNKDKNDYWLPNQGTGTQVPD